MMALDYAGETDVGRVRRENQDRWYADPQQGLFLVADGMGGSTNGKLAADAVAEVLPRLIRQRIQETADLASPKAACELVRTVAELSDRLRKESQQHVVTRGIGSTVVLALIRGGRARVVHLGDSRAYLLHHGRLRQLTRDHSLLQAMVETGVLSSEEATSHPARAQLTQFVGMPGVPVPPSELVALVPGDRLLLCTDGLYGRVDFDHLRAALAQDRPSQEVCRSLVSAAMEAGGQDNITALVVTAVSPSRSARAS